MMTDLYAKHHSKTEALEQVMLILPASPTHFYSWTETVQVQAVHFVMQQLFDRADKADQCLST